MSDHKISVVLFTDDAASGELLKYLLSMQGDIEVVAIADNVKDLYEYIRQLTPDVVTIVSDPDAGQMIAEDIHTNAPGIYVITWDAEKFRQDAGELADGMTMTGAGSFKAPNELADAIRSVRSREQTLDDLASDVDEAYQSPAEGPVDDAPQAQSPSRGVRTRGGADFDASGGNRSGAVASPAKPSATPPPEQAKKEEIDTVEEAREKSVEPEPAEEKPAARREPVADMPFNVGSDLEEAEEEAPAPKAMGKSPAPGWPSPPPPPTSGERARRQPGEEITLGVGGNVKGDLNVAGGDVVHGDKVGGDKITIENATIVSREEALKYETQARRFDAAFPENVEHKKTAILWVGVARPDDPPPFEDAIAASATKGPTADIKLPVNPETGEAEEVQIDVEIRAPQYDPSIDRATLTIYPDGTADRVKFLLEAQDEGEGIVMVRFYLDKKRLGEIELNSLVQKARAGMKFGLKLQVATVYLAFGVG